MFRYGQKNINKICVQDCSCMSSCYMGQWGGVAVYTPAPVLNNRGDVNLNKVGGIKHNK